MFDKKKNHGKIKKDTALLTFSKAQKAHFDILTNFSLAYDSPTNIDINNIHR